MESVAGEEYKAPTRAFGWWAMLYLCNILPAALQFIQMLVYYVDRDVGFFVFLLDSRCPASPSLVDARVPANSSNVAELRSRAGVVVRRGEACPSSSRFV